jgi:hypothetical protein
MVDYQAACAPDASVAALNTRDRGICLYLSQRYGDAILELEGYLDLYTEAVDRDAIAGARACAAWRQAAFCLFC